MLRFKQYIAENKKPRSITSKVSNDDKGKLNELLLAYHLNGKKLPDHFRSESENTDHAGTPQDVHDRLKKKLEDAGHGAAYDEINANAAQMANHIIRRATQHGHTISHVHWTSNPHDHEKLTGVKDKNSNADLILTLHKNGKKTYHGISAKYGSESKTNYGTSGIDSIERSAGLKSGALAEHDKRHYDNMTKLGYKGTRLDQKAEHKVDGMGIEKAKAEHDKLSKLITSGKKLKPKHILLHKHLTTYIEKHDNIATPKARSNFLAERMERHKAANASARIRNRAINTTFAEGLSKLNESQLRKHVADHLAPETLHPHTLAKSRVDSDGSSEPIVKSFSEIRKIPEDYHSLHVTSSGVSTTVWGTHKKTGKKIALLTHGIKNQSGPATTVNSTATSSIVK